MEYCNHVFFAAALKLQTTKANYSRSQMCLLWHHSVLGSFTAADTNNKLLERQSRFFHLSTVLRKASVVTGGEFFLFCFVFYNVTGELLMIDYTFQPHLSFPCPWSAILGILDLGLPLLLASVSKLAQQRLCRGYKVSRGGRGDEKKESCLLISGKSNISFISSYS